MRSGKAEKRDAHRDGETMERPEYGTKTPRPEFLKNCINSDKFTMFFDKFLKIYPVDFQGVMYFMGWFSTNFNAKEFRSYVNSRGVFLHQAPRDHQPLNVVRALAHLQENGVAVIALDGQLLDVAVPPVNVHGGF